MLSSGVAQILLMIIGLGFFLEIPSQGSEFTTSLISHPIFTQSRKFELTPPDLVVTIPIQTASIKVQAFTKALEKCKLTPQQIQGELNLILDPQSAIWDRLNRLIPESFNRTEELHLTLLIDDFSNFAGSVPEFTSYYLPENPAVIGLDCRSLQHFYWMPSISHELVHALLNGRNVESGWEEGLAQVMENDAGGVQPELSLKHLESSSSVLPVLLETRRPLPSHESYAINYLFTRYIKSKFGDWPALRGMTGLTDSTTSCEYNLDFLTQAACKLALTLMSPGLFPLPDAGRLPLEKATRNGLLRYFYVALGMNNSSSPHYSIPGWEGFSKLPLQAQDQVLEPGQAAFFQDESDLKQVNSSLEVYQIQIDPESRFRILRTSSIEPDEISDFKPSQILYLAINLGKGAVSLLH
jgi:hypothetical protein